MILSVLAPIGLLAAVVVALTVCLWLFAALKREQAIRDETTGAELRRISSALEDAQRRLARLEEDLDGAPAASATAAGMNLTKRTQAVRLLRKGEDPDRVAAVLNLPRKEVELLSKVNRIAAESATSSRAATA